VLGDVPGVEARFVRGFRDLQLVLEDLACRRLRPLDPVENAEFQRALLKDLVRHDFSPVDSQLKDRRQFLASGLAQIITGRSPNGL